MLGIVIEHHMVEGGNSLTVLPIERLRELVRLGDEDGYIARELGLDNPKRWTQLPSKGQDKRAVGHNGGAAVQQFVRFHLSAPFGGRSRELGRLSAWLDAPKSSPCLLLCAPSGRGKSTLLTRWQQALQVAGDSIDIVFVPISLRFDLAGQEAVLRSLAAQLATAFGDDWSQVSANDVAEVHDRVSTYLSRTPPTGRLLIVLDGLDEARGWDVSPGFLAPTTLAPGIRIAVSARQTERRPDGDSWLSALGWSPFDCEVMYLQTLDEAGVRDALETVQPSLTDEEKDAAQRLLTTLTAGDPLVLGLYLTDLQKSTERTQWLDSIQAERRPSGLGGYIDRWWGDQEKLWGGTLASRGRHVGTVYSLLACALEPLPRVALLRLAKSRGLLDGDELDGVLRELDRWILVTQLYGPHYSLSHPRLSEHRKARLATDDELSGYLRAYIAWGLEVLEAYRGDAATPLQTGSTYIINHMSTYMQEVHSAPEEFFQLVGPAWQRAWEDSTAEFDGYSRDVNRVLEACRRSNKRAVVVGEPPPNLFEEIACLTALADASSESSALTPELVVQLLRHSVWSDQRALAFVAARPTDELRARALRLIAAHLSSDSLGEIRRRLSSTQFDPDEPDAYQDALAALVLALANSGSTDEALHVIATEGSLDSLRRLQIHSELMTVATPAVRAPLLSSLLDSVSKSPGAALLLTPLTRSIPREEVYAALEGPDPEGRLLGMFDLESASFSDGESVANQSALLAALCPWLPDWAFASLASTVWRERGVSRAKEIAALGDSVADIRRRKEVAIDSQDFELAAGLRDKEKSTLATLRQLEQAWSALGPVTPLIRAISTRLSMSAESAEGRLSGEVADPANWMSMAGRAHNSPVVRPPDPSPPGERSPNSGDAAAPLHPSIVELLRNPGSLEEFLEEELEEFGRLMKPRDLRSLIEVVTKSGGQSVHNLLPQLLARYAAIGPTEAQQALQLAGADNRMSPVDADLPELFGSAVRWSNVRWEPGRLCALGFESKALDSSDLLRRVGSFDSGRLALEAVSMLLPRLRPTSLGVEAVSAVNDALQRAPSGHSLLDPYLLTHVRRVLTTHGVPTASEFVDRLFPFPRRVAGMLLASAAAASRDKELIEETLRLLRRQGVLHPSVSDLTRQYALGVEGSDPPERALDLLSQLLESLDHRGCALILSTLPGPWKEYFANHLSEQDRMVSLRATYRSANGWVRLVTGLIEVLGEDQVRAFPELLRQEENVAPVLEGLLYVEAALRLYLAEDPEGAIHFIQLIPRARERTRALVRISDVMTDAFIPRWVAAMRQNLAGVAVVEERMVLWSRIGHRLRNLRRHSAWAVWESCLGQSSYEDRLDVVGDLVGLVAGLPSLTTDDLNARIAGLLA